MLKKCRVLSGLLALASVIYCKHYDIVWSQQGVQQYCHRILVRSGDTLEFTCPLGAFSTIWYMVTQEQYNNCECGNSTCIRAAFCPGLIQYNYTIGIVRNSEQLGHAQDYQPGKTYYFASFSSGDYFTIDQDSGGECVSDELRLQVEVLPVDTCTCEFEGQGLGLAPSSSLSSDGMTNTPLMESDNSTCERRDPLSGAFGIGVAVGAVAMAVLASIMVAVVLSVMKYYHTPSSKKVTGQRNMAFDIYDTSRKVDDSHIYDAPSKLLGE